jgi:hypothetical protein
MMKVLILCLTAGALISAGVAAQASVPASTQAKPAKPKVKRVCRERMRSGSHLSNVVCKTPEEWARLQADVDDQDEYGVPGNKTATGRAIDRGPPRTGRPSIR